MKIIEQNKPERQFQIEDGNLIVREVEEITRELTPQEAYDFFNKQVTERNNIKYQLSIEFVKKKKKELEIMDALIKELEPQITQIISNQRQLIEKQKQTNLNELKQKKKGTIRPTKADVKKPEEKGDK